ncbi:MAG: HAD family phosphatase [Leptolyngbya sp. SIO3F4]|nr:HAD family phosphatase [Leptolyngbya sp. SIO3F4]
MRYRAIATDYDGTLATDGHVDEATQTALQRYQQAGGKLLMVTGRELTDLQAAFPALATFDGVVVENGAVFFHPPSQRLQRLADSPPKEFVETLKTKQVSPIHTGHIIVSTWQPHGAVVQQTIQDMGLASQVIMNKKAVMVLPTGINKATGLTAALKELDLTSDQVAGIGDAENDFDLLSHCGLGVAVANALPTVKDMADRVTTQPRGAGVQELIDWILNDDF